MKRFKIAPHAPEMSAMAYGCWRLDSDTEGTDVKRVRAKIDASLEAGITTFDHADIYGRYTNEGHFGKALAEAPELRDQMEIITKCAIRIPSDALPDINEKHYDATADTIVKCVDRSLSELQTDHIDLLLIHRPDWLTDAEDTAKGLTQVLESGKVLSVGVSNYSVHQYNLLAHYLDKPPATNQVELHLLHMDPIYDGTLDQCQALGVHPQSWSPLAGGRIFTENGEAETRTREALEKVAAEYGATADQIALAWVNALPCQPQLIIGTNTIDRIASAAEAEAITLEREHWYYLWTAAKGRGIP